MSKESRCLGGRLDGRYSDDAEEISVNGMKVMELCTALDLRVINTFLKRGL